MNPFNIGFLLFIAGYICAAKFSQKVFRAEHTRTINYKRYEQTRSQKLLYQTSEEKDGYTSAILRGFPIRVR